MSAGVTPEEVAEVMANHHGARGLECFGDEYDCPYYWPCPTYRVAEALVAERAKVARLASALERTEGNFRLAVHGHPVRDMAENLAENAAARA